MRDLLFFLLIGGLLAHEVQLLKKRRIAACRTPLEYAAIAAGLALLGWVTWRFASTPVHYAFAAIGIAALAADVLKDGLADEGVLIVARGRELYLWEQLGHIELSHEKAGLLTLRVFSPAGGILFKQTYRLCNEEAVRALLAQHIALS